MKTIVVQYQTKPERADENQKLIEAVFAELAERRPDGFGYASFRLDDGVTFVHLAVERNEGDASLNDLPAFREFTSDIADRCATLPVARAASVVGSYRIVSE